MEAGGERERVTKHSALSIQPVKSAADYADKRGSDYETKKLFDPRNLRNPRLIFPVFRSVKIRVNPWLFFYSAERHKCVNVPQTGVVLIREFRVIRGEFCLGRVLTATCHQPSA
jgi:hypothetical protein